MNKKTNIERLKKRIKFLKSYGCFVYAMVLEKELEIEEKKLEIGENNENVSMQ